MLDLRPLLLGPLACLAMLCISCELGVRSPAGAPRDPSTQVFNTERVLDVAVELDPDDWRRLRYEGRTFSILAEGCADAPPVRPYHYYPASVSVDGKRMENVGVRKKGFLGSLLIERPSLKLRFNRYVESQHFAGLRRLTLNNNRQDQSQIRQCLAYKIYADAGVPAPRCGFARVTVNGEELGIYTAVEGVKKPMLARHFAEDGGKLYEGQLSDFRTGWIATFQAKTQKGIDERSEIHELVRTLRTGDHALLDLLDARVDLDAFLTFWATESLISAWDGYTNNQNNFFIYLDPTTRKFHFIPWGSDLVFQEGDPFRDVERPTSVSAFGKLPYRLYAIPEMRERYLKRVRELLDTVWNEEALLAETERLETLLAPHADPDALLQIRNFIQERRAVVEKELEGDGPEWEFDLKPSERCWVTQPEVTASFSTTWGTLEAENPFEHGEASLQIVLDGEEQEFVKQTAVAGEVSSALGPQPAINVMGLLEDGSVVVLSVRVEPGLFEAGDVDFHGFGTWGLAVVVVDGETQRKGLVSDGTITLDVAGTDEGAAISGRLTAVRYSRPPKSR